MSRDPERDAVKAVAEQVRIRQQRMRDAEEGKLGRTYEERREKLEKLRARQRQAKLDQREASERIFGEIKPGEVGS